MVDASQGVEAQTLANVYQAIDNNHEIVPVLNKVDLPAAEPDQVKQQIEDVIGLDASNAIQISAKTGLGVPEVLEAIVTRLPPPKGDRAAPLKALLVDSWYDSYLGVVVLRAHLRRRAAARPAHAHDGHRRELRGRPRRRVHAQADAGRRTGPRRDRLPHRLDQGRGRHPRRRHHHRRAQAGRRGAARLPAVDPGGVLRPLPGRRRATSRTCAPRSGKLRLNDASFTYEMETSAALGFGFRCGFLGLLHLEIIQERLTREFNLDLIATAPSVIYKIKQNDGEEIEIHNPVDMPDPVYDQGDRGALDPTPPS